MFNGFLNIPPHRLSTAYFVFHCMVASTFCSITVIPYVAAINSHEDIFVISIIYTLESFAKLGIAFYLQYTLHDKLIVYGLLLATIYCIATLIYRWYCHTHYKEIHIKIKTNKDTTKELVKFSFWTVIGNASRIISTQGSTILLNLFGGTVANAAYGIANQVNGQMSFFSASLLQAIEPQIMKSEGNNDTHRMKRLSLLTCKLSFFLISFSASLFLQDALHSEFMVKGCTGIHRNLLQNYPIDSSDEPNYDGTSIWNIRQRAYQKLSVSHEHNTTPLITTGFHLTKSRISCRNHSIFTPNGRNRNGHIQNYSC